MKIGYSFWGFLGPGITDTPDGGRSHRRVLIDALVAAGHDIVFLQIDRDLAEAGDRLGDRYAFDVGLPDIDALMLEWRWPIPGRNTTLCGRPGHTCDLHRQNELVRYYSHVGVPTIAWDKDLRMEADDPMRTLTNVVVAEAGLHPRPGAASLLFPVADQALDAADPEQLARLPRSLPLVYIGNQYDRDDAFETFLSPAASRFRHRIAGKWADTARWPHLNFTGRISFEQVKPLYADALATVLLAPPRYDAIAQVTQRLPEAVLNGCMPITPACLRDAGRFTPGALHVDDGADVIAVLEHIAGIAGTNAHAGLLQQCLGRLDTFRASRQVDVIETILTELRRGSAVGPYAGPVEAAR